MQLIIFTFPVWFDLQRKTQIFITCYVIYFDETIDLFKGD